MALPLLLSFLGSGLAKAGVLGAAGSFLSNPLIMGAIGSGVGTAIETGDVKKGIGAGLGSFVGGKALGSVMGGGGSGHVHKRRKRSNGPVSAPRCTARQLDRADSRCRHQRCRAGRYGLRLIRSRYRLDVRWRVGRRAYDFAAKHADRAGA